ncbi:phosphopantetheine attachment domain protein [Cooperia oncophora]
MLDALTDAELNRIQKVEKLIVGGDAVRDRNLVKVLNSGLDVTQIYGPTEGTVWSLTNRCKALPEEGSLIGKPVLNETCWLAEGVKEGELVLSGAKVARGYFNDPNNESFYRTNGVPCYRTGDIVRNDKEGFIYRGRIDSQMKVRGHRIESLEVERAILETSLNISEAKVIALKESLIAFIVHDKPLDSATVLAELEATLPSYMVPSRFVRVPEIPLNSSGKVNKEKLLEEYSRTTVDCAAPTTTQMSLTEQRVASVFEKLLGLKNVRSTDNFFTLGGHSLLLFELKNQLLTEFDLNIEVHDLFANLTVQEMARFITKQSREAGDTSIITKLREAPEAKFNVYLIHAIGGSVFPYYAFLQVFPKTVNIYAIEYQLHFEADTIKQLAAFYARAIAAHTRDVRPFPMGHSLGGTISREIVAELKLWGWEIPFVMMFDTWMVQQLNMERVTAFAKKTFLALPDYEDRVKKTTRLADMLRRHTCAISTTKIYLFKSAEVSDDEAFRRVVRPDLNESILRAMTDNRLGSSSTQPIDVWLIDGNHESCMKPGESHHSQGDDTFNFYQLFVVF